MISKAIKSAFKKKSERGWDKIYWCIDAHDTIFPGEYDPNQSFNPYKEAIEVLQHLSNKEDMVLILWTCSYSKDIQRLQEWFWNEYKIKFDYYNENPECPNTELAEFTNKFYFNILLDDKAGFNPKSDWKEIKDVLIKLDVIEPDYIEIGNDDHIISIDEFKEDCDQDYFIDDDGFGQFIKNGKIVVQTHVNPSDTCDNPEFGKGYEGVVWYNR